MSKYKVWAYDLGHLDKDAGKAGSKVKVKQIEINDRDDDGVIREDGAGGPGDKIGKDVISTMKHKSTLELEDGSVITGWYVEVEHGSGDKHAYFIPTDGSTPEKGKLAKDIDKNGDQYDDLDRILDPVPCFTAGSLIISESGLIPVEAVGEGMRIVTRDNGFQTVRWAGQRRILKRDLNDRAPMAPIVFKAGALGNGMPERDMAVSPNHRMLITGGSVQTHFGETEAFVAARHLTHLPGVERAGSMPVTYVHLLFDSHEVVLADGAWSESFCPGGEGLKGFGEDQKKEVLTLFPELLDRPKSYQLARPSMKAYEARAAV